MTDAIGGYTPHRTHADAGEDVTTCGPQRPDPGTALRASSPQLEAWRRMEAAYTAGMDGGSCELEPMSYAQEGAEATGTPTRAERPETYEQCVNRATREASQMGRWAVATAGCVGAAASVAPAGPVGMAVMCVVGGVPGYYAGGDAGAAIGNADAKVECDRPDKPGSPSERATEEPGMTSPAERGPIRG